MIRESLIAAALIATPAAGNAAASAPARQEQVVKIGILDTAAANITGHDGRTVVHYREFTRPGMKSGRWKMENGADHGEVMATVFVNQIRSMDKNVKIEVYSANITEQHPTNPKALLFNTDGAREALQWFSDHGVKTVMTTMVGKDSESMRGFMAEADRLHMTVFASAGNQVKRGVAAYPAAYPQAISVSGDGPTLALRNDPSVARWVNFAVDGQISTHNQDDPYATTDGSSMAVSRASAMGAYAIYAGKAFDRDSTLAALKGISVSKSFKVKDSAPVEVSYIDRKSAGARMAQLSLPVVKSAALHPAPSLQAQMAARMAVLGR